MVLSRRQFASTGLAALSFGGLARHAWARASRSYRNEVAGYGPLLEDPAGYLDLPRGFSYRVLSSAGEEMADGLLVPDHFDGMGCLPVAGGRLALIRNHELDPEDGAKGPAGGNILRSALLSKLPSYGRDTQGQVLPGGTTTLVIDQKTLKREAEYVSLAGTVANCAGGVTPWGSWLTCEETVMTLPEVGQSHGWLFEIPATARGPVQPLPLKAMGRFRHEAVAIDPRTGVAYLTEDRENGLFYRFIPHTPGQLANGGRLQALALLDGETDSRNWTAVNFIAGMPRDVRWIDLDDVESSADDLRERGHAAGAAIFARGEGIHHGSGADGQIEFFFACTSGGAKRLGQIFRLKPSVAGGPDCLELFFESIDPEVMDYADNLTLSPWGDLIVCEDRIDGKVNHLRCVTPKGKVYTLARLNADTELTGACFSPDGSVLFVNAYSPGRTIAITRFPKNTT